MTTVQPEFCRRIPTGRIGAAGLEQTIEADAGERAALASRLRIPAIASFTCRFVLAAPRQGQIGAEAELRAELTRTCVVSLEPFETTVRERFALRFVPEGLEQDDPDPDSLDELPYAGDMIDLGETAAEQLALALDPYPRMPGVALPPEGDLPDDAQAPARINAFAALAALRGGKGDA